MVIASDAEDCNQGVQCQKSSGQKNTISVESKVPSGPAANANGEQKGAAILNGTMQISLAMYDEICRKENLKIRQAILGDLAFIELCLENSLKALST
jgi:CCR4-NOT transcription complex subunit 10